VSDVNSAPSYPWVANPGIRSTLPPAPGSCDRRHQDERPDHTQVAGTIVTIVDTPHGKRAFRVHIDPANDGSETVSAVADHIRAEFLTRIGLQDLLAPTTLLPEGRQSPRSPGTSGTA
jgi:hypothetical protein